MATFLDVLEARADLKREQDEAAAFLGQVMRKLLESQTHATQSSNPEDHVLIASADSIRLDKLIALGDVTLLLDQERTPSELTMSVRTQKNADGRWTVGVAGHKSEEVSDAGQGAAIVVNALLSALNNLRGIRQSYKP